MEEVVLKLRPAADADAHVRVMHVRLTASLHASRRVVRMAITIYCSRINYNGIN